jgi:hypothetical protein
VEVRRVKRVQVVEIVLADIHLELAVPDPQRHKIVLFPAREIRR